MVFYFPQVMVFNLTYSRLLLQGRILFSPHWVMTQVEEKILKFNIVLHIYLYIPNIHQRFKFLSLMRKQGVGYMAKKGRTGNPKTISPTRSAGD